MTDWPDAHARNSDPVTSQAAAETAGERALTDCERVVGVLLELGPRGAEQIGDECGIDAYVVRKRLADLEHNGSATPTDELRKTRSGRHERIWRAL